MIPPQQMTDHAAARRRDVVSAVDSSRRAQTALRLRLAGLVRLAGALRRRRRAPMTTAATVLRLSTERTP